MSRDEWKQGRGPRGQGPRGQELAGEFPAHQVEALLSTIELAGRGYPSTEVWESVVHQAEEIRNGVREERDLRLRLRGCRR